MQILKNYLVWQYISLGVDIPKKEYYFVKSHIDPGGGGRGRGLILSSNILSFDFYKNKYSCIWFVRFWLATHLWNWLKLCANLTLSWRMYLSYRNQSIIIIIIIIVIIIIIIIIIIVIIIIKKSGSNTNWFFLPKN